MTMNDEFWKHQQYNFYQPNKSKSEILAETTASFINQKAQMVDLDGAHSWPICHNSPTRNEVIMESFRRFSLRDVDGLPINKGCPRLIVASMNH